jgi:glutaredoxin
MPTKKFDNQEITTNGTAVVVATVQHKPMRCLQCKASFSVPLSEAKSVCPHCQGTNTTDDPHGSTSLVVTATVGGTTVEHSWSLKPLDTTVDQRSASDLQDYLDQLRNDVAAKAAAREAERLVVANLI